MDQAIKHKLIKTGSIIFAVVTMIISATLAFNYFSTEDLLAISNETDKIYHAVDKANGHILTAKMVAPNKCRIIEANKRFLTRADADKSYRKLNDLIPRGGVIRKEFEDMRDNRESYRMRQNAVVGAILEDPDDPNIFVLWRDYQEYKTRYTSHLQSIQKLVAHDMATRGKAVMVLFAGFITSLIITINLALSRILKTRYANRRQCSICLDNLPSRISLTVKQTVGEEIRVGRVCCECFESIYPKHRHDYQLKRYRVVKGKPQND